MPVRFDKNNDSKIVEQVLQEVPISPTLFVIMVFF